MIALDRTHPGRLTRVGLVVLALVTLLALVAVLAAPTGTAAPKAGPGPEPITLVFAGQLDGDEGIGPFVDPWPPIEGGVAQVYIVPAGLRLVIDSLWAEVNERWTSPTTPRDGVTVGVASWYDLGECAYPGYQRSYGIPLTDPVVGEFEDGFDVRRNGNASGPIFVEGGRSVAGTAYGPGGDSDVFVSITVHGHLEAATNPVPPVCGG